MAISHPLLFWISSPPSLPLLCWCPCTEKKNRSNQRRTTTSTHQHSLPTHLPASDSLYPCCPSYFCEPTTCVYQCSSSSTTLWYLHLHLLKCTTPVSLSSSFWLHQPPSFYGFFPTSIQVSSNVFNLKKKSCLKIISALLKRVIYLPVPLLAFLFFSSCQTSRLIILIVSCCFSLIFFLNPVSIRLILPAPTTMPLSGSPMALLVLSPMVSSDFYPIDSSIISLFLKSLLHLIPGHHLSWFPPPH